MFNFKILHRDKRTQARLGVLRTPHGEVHTPAFVPVATQATVKTLTPSDLKGLGVQILIANSYHLHLRPGEELIARMGGLHRFMGWPGPIMTDSGGFQAFSLGAGREHGVGKVASIFPEEADRGGHLRSNRGESKVKIGEEGVRFRSHIDGSEHLFTPEGAIEIQRKLGSDLMMALDECTSPLHDYAYTRSAMERTHRWAERALAHYRRLDIQNQALYGIVQGGAFRDLREQSAQFIGRLGFWGLAIGGSLGKSKQEMIRVLEWTVPHLPPERPRHLLGIGEVEDIFEAVRLGIDTFDCVAPTRLARYGTALVWGRDRGRPKGRLDLTASPCRDDPAPIAEDCLCATCRTHSRAYLHHLFHAKEPLAGRLLTVHNVHFMEEVCRRIREALAEGTFEALRASWRGEWSG